MSSFTEQVKAFTIKAQNETHKKARTIVNDLFTRIVLRTPSDDGTLRANWHVSVGAPSSKVISYKGDGGFTTTIDEPTQAFTQAVFAAQSKIDEGIGNVIWINNNIGYVQIVEYGGYPNPVPYGTYLGQGESKHGRTGPGNYSFSDFGYSIFAPRGMVGVSVTAIKAKYLV